MIEYMKPLLIIDPLPLVYNVRFTLYTKGIVFLFQKPGAMLEQKDYIDRSGCILILAYLLRFVDGVVDQHIAESAFQGLKLVRKL